MALRDGFLPDLLEVSIEEVTDSLHKRNTWGAKRMGIEIPDPTQTAPTNFEMLEHFCDLLPTYIFNREELDIMAHATQVR